MKHILAIMLSALSVYVQGEQVRYADKFHGFGPFGTHQSGELVIGNSTCWDKVITDTAQTDCYVRFDINFANFNNKENKEYTICGEDGSKRKVSSPCWGVVWNYADSLNYEAMVLNCKNTAPYDAIIDRRLMTVRHVRSRNGIRTTVDSTDLDKGVNLYTGFNTASVEIKENKLRLRIGDRVMTQIFKERCCTPHGTTGILVGKGARVKVERICIKIERDKSKVLETKWTEDSLKVYFAGCDNAIEGFWQYLDRRIESESVSIGGRYRIAIVRNDKLDRYDIIYLSGATVCGDKWKEGMLKGWLTTTRFVNNYTLMWLDAEKAPFTDDTYATMEQGCILELNFPAEKSQLRFVKGQN